MWEPDFYRLLCFVWVNIPLPRVHLRSKNATGKSFQVLLKYCVLIRCLFAPFVSAEYDLQEGKSVTVDETTNSSISISSMEMLAIGGFGLFFGWMFIVFFWLFCEFPPAAAISERDLTQFFVFAAMPAGFFLVHLSGRNPKYNIFAFPAWVTELVFAIVLPVIALVMYQGVAVPMVIVCLANLLAGLSAAGVQTSWLDVCSRLETDRYSRVTSLSLFVGGLLFVLVSFSPNVMQPLFGIIYIVLSMVLLRYSSKNAPRNDERAPLESVSDTWRFTKEIEPSFFMFGVVFGITFVFLFNNGSEQVLLGLISTLVGSIAIAIISISDHQASITTYQRGLVMVTMCACIVVPFVPFAGQIACSCVVTAAWAMFLAINYGYIVRKCVIAWEAPLFRQAPIRLMIPALGFAVGWAIAAIITGVFGAHSEVFMYMRLGVAILLVAMVMVFFPSKDHHPIDGSSPESVKVQTTVVAVDKSERELFEERCAAVAKLYQLSPRETEILQYLAKGRNAAYIQEELVISPHTVKSHIYNIYRKLDIHSQQKLMDFVEEFPLES